jgi:hypothetical protein
MLPSVIISFATDHGGLVNVSYMCVTTGWIDSNSNAEKRYC